MIDDPPSDVPPPFDALGTEFHLAPSQAESLAERKAPLIPLHSNATGPPTDPPSQFSLGELLVGMAMVSVGLSGLVWLSPPIYAGVCGFLALAMLIATVIWKPNAPLFQLLWYALLVMYMVSIVIALLAPTHAGR
jgi:hypothetical protein